MVGETTASDLDLSEFHKIFPESFRYLYSKTI